MVVMMRLRILRTARGVRAFEVTVAGNMAVVPEGKAFAYSSSFRSSCRGVVMVMLTKVHSTVASERSVRDQGAFLLS